MVGLLLGFPSAPSTARVRGGRGHFAGLCTCRKPNWSTTSHVAARCANLSHGLEALREHARNMHGLPAGTVPDLVTAGGAVSNDNGVGGCFSHRGQQR